MRHIFEWSPEDMRSIAEAEKNLYVYGFVEVLDFLGEPHETRFCFMALVNMRDDAYFQYVINRATPRDYLMRT